MSIAIDHFDHVQISIDTDALISLGAIADLPDDVQAALFSADLDVPTDLLIGLGAYGDDAGLALAA